MAYGGLQAEAHTDGGPELYVDKRLELSKPELSKVANIIDLGSQVNNGQVLPPPTPENRGQKEVRVVLNIPHTEELRSAKLTRLLPSCQ